MHLNQLIILNCKSRKEPEHTGHLRLLYCPAATGEHLTDQQPECTSRAILILLSCGTVRVCTPAGSLDKYRSLQHHPQCVAAYSQAGSIPSCPASCRCGQLRTDREYPAVQMGGFFDTPRACKAPPGSFYTLPQLTDTPALQKAPVVFTGGGDLPACAQAVCLSGGELRGQSALCKRTAAAQASCTPPRHGRRMRHLSRTFRSDSL